MLVEARVVGQRGSTIEPRPIEDVPVGPEVPLRALIAHIVRAEVAAYDARDGERRLVRVLSFNEIAAGAVAGRIDSGGHERRARADADTAVATALEAFDDGLYLVFVDGQQVEDLDTRVLTGPDTRIRFLRLTALAGG